jgi:hypothetical protein
MVLEEEEVALAEHLSAILGDDRHNSVLVMRAILPVYWRREVNHRFALPHRSIFKILHHEVSAGMRKFDEKIRDFLADAAGHLE